MLKKYVAWSFVLVLVVISVDSVVHGSTFDDSRPMNRGTFLYVGGSGSGHYHTIQGAIDDAAEGDTVFVYGDSSPYYEHVSIEKSLNLVGEDMNTTVIDGSHLRSVVWVSPYKKVVISGFTIQNSGSYTSPYGWADAGISLWGAYAVIVGNTIRNNLCGVHLYCSHDNNISGNIISFNEYGVYLPPSLGYCERNVISGNIIQGNEKGICMKTPEKNDMFHNNFMQNTEYNAWGHFSDSWDGNYWDDYSGSDENHDGIGDTPYLIPGGSNQDHYPLMHPWVNLPPSAPSIAGLSNGKPWKMYNYTFNATDPTGDTIVYCVKWGDGSISGWIDAVPSGQEMNTTHRWSRGLYTIRAKAKDSYGAESDWATLSVKIPCSYDGPIPQLFNWLLERFPHAFPFVRHVLMRFQML